ncbi:hypothetical protein JNB88_28935 [Rhizobium cauense]|uniref:hypothetical protein n=1 Tax=Rhizobium cauense TaxID=1166683 RepID=UPI001C6E2A9B|nr:hypothetical protein [Rhizobium cauense]MBW9117651.1 hypothetical protein [Rhizobium cauense]
MPVKQERTAALKSEGAKVGERVPRAIIDTNTASVGIAPQPEFDAEAEIGALRQQLETLRQQVSDASAAITSGARRVARQTEATVKNYPASSLLGVAAIAAALALAVGLQPSRRQSRYDRMLDDMRDLYERVRDRL